MKIYVRALVDGGLILEEIEASPVQGFEDCAIAHIEKHRWVVYDTPTGLLIVSGHTRKEAMDNLIERRLEMYEARKTKLYERRLQEFEEMKKNDPSIYLWR